MKIIDEREKKNTKKTNKDRKQQEERTEAIVKGLELNDFIVHLS